MERSHHESVEAAPPLPAFTDMAPPDRYCDLILTGGITSAIAYPPAICTLASVYRLRSLGGASSGAGSAALAAAAEYRRRHGSAQGFQTLLERTAEVADCTDGRTNLEWLFQPAEGKQRLFNTLVRGLAKPGNRLVGEFFASYFLWPLVLAVLLLVGIALIVAVQQTTYRFAIGVGSTLFVIVLGVWWGIDALWGDVRRVLDDGYGLCTGKDPSPGAPRPPLTVWLHNLIQEVAGRPFDKAPLTFADLEAAPGAPSDTLGTRAAGDELAIRLQMFTANLTLGRPCLFPRSDDPDEVESSVLYFLPGEMRRLFPDAVVDHMVEASQPYTGDAQPYPRSRLAAYDAGGEPFRRLPGRQLPIVVAARMSVSFPVLFNAVPLWVVEHKHRPDGSVDARIRRCLFADGGFCSNFPIHLFDSAVPDWPTFGISLRDLIEDTEKGKTERDQMFDSIQLPKRHNQPIEEVWQDFDDRPGGRLGGFVGAMLATVKDWNDATLARLPGVRDRVVRVGLSPGIGGLNILMDGRQIRLLADVGREAAIRLLKRFVLEAGPDGLAPAWHEHRWVRFNILRDCLVENLAGFGASARASKFAKPLSEHIEAATQAAPLHGDESSQLLASQAAALQGVLAALQDAERALSASVAQQPYTPRPRPNLRIRPPL
ncbi:patatin-like phospholipase family protein [Piscinibacter gummiphilus]|uniref:Patatin-like phospholipase family protein n=1 Tax=Piscinibacter gummiphilus TaxID=946333 RepID=A0ABZ0CZ95_9BURK|nr:patatin-like phospholipase family protein [Piscinibacter gummiphilus]WOB08486.1 patatin-like phospholipase family protein [Piscinibacter gummiphilus]